MELKVDRGAAVRKLKTLALPARGNVDSFRKKLNKTFLCEFLPNRVECAEEDIGDVKCDVLSPEAFSSDRITIYVHGGSFVGGSRDSYRGFCSSLSHVLYSRILVPDFRLAPAHPYPSSADDVASVLSSFLTGKDRKEIILCADGSGASIALACVFKLTADQRALISKVILFSPWLNLASDSFPKKHMKDEVLSSDSIIYAADLYTYSSNLKNPCISPLRAKEEDIEGFPEVYIQMGEKELLLYQAKQFCDMLSDRGIKNTLDAVPDMMFMFQMADEYLDEPHLALERLGKYVNRRQGPSPREILERDRLIKENHIMAD